MPEPPCNTSGTGEISEIFFNNGRSTFGSISSPCTFPTETASRSQPVRVTKSSTMSGSVFASASFTISKVKSVCNFHCSTSPFLNMYDSVFWFLFQVDCFVLRFKLALIIYKFVTRKILSVSSQGAKKFDELPGKNCVNFCANMLCVFSFLRKEVA